MTQSDIMAPSKTWIVGDDGSLGLGEDVLSVTYHTGLNVVIVTTKSNNVKVVDIPSGMVLRDCKFSGFTICDLGGSEQIYRKGKFALSRFIIFGLSSNHDGVQCQYVTSLDRVVYCDSRAIGIRKDLSGVLLLDTALQTPIKRSEDNIFLELLLPEANSLLSTLMTAELPGVDYVDDVLRELEKEIETSRQNSKGNHKQSKWNVVCLKLPHCALKTVCRSLIEELKRQNDRKPGLATAAAVFDRLQCLFPKSDSDSNGTNGVVDRSLMYSELARRETFNKWPHMNYKWALPSQMAQAGFYHQPASSGDDRALCFTCNVCLVCWEPTDEPWSEHERHSPQCPFVKGEFTHNVPCAASYASEPAYYHGNDNDTVHIECISTTSSSEFIASSSIHGNIVVWDTSKHFKKHIEFNVDPWEGIIASKTGTGASVYGLEPAPPPASNTAHDSTASSSAPDSPSEEGGTTVTSSVTSQSNESLAHKDDIDAISVPVPSAQVLNKSDETHSSSPPPGMSFSGEILLESSAKPPSYNSSMTLTAEDTEDDNTSKAEVIEVGGAWKVTLKESSAVATSVEGDIVEIPLENEEPKENIELPQRRCRPSLDVLVSALSILKKPETFSASASTSSATAQIGARPCLVNGVAIRRNSALDSGISTMPLCSDSDENSEVQALNQVNQALTEDSQSQIILQNTSSDSPTPNPFVSYLLVHDISSLSNPKSGDDNWSSASRGSGTKNKTGKLGASSDTWKPMPVTSGGMSMALVQQIIPKPQVLNMSAEGMYNMADEMDSDEEYDMMMAPTAPKPLASQQQSLKFGSVNVPALLPLNKKTENPAGNSKQSGVATVMSKIKIAKEGQVLQCIELPNQIGTDQYIRSITPTIDGKYVIVSMAPRCLNRKLELIANNRAELIENCSDSDSSDSTPQNSHQANANKATHTYTNGGYLLLYKVIVKDGSVMLNSQPETVSEPWPNVSDAVIQICVLPPEAAHAHDDDETMTSPTGNGCSDGSGGPDGQIAVTTHDGRVKIINICDFKVLATISAPNEEQFVDVTYCSGIDRLCCCAKDGRLFFYTMRPSQPTLTTHPAAGELPATVVESSASPGKGEDGVDGGMPAGAENHSAELLLVRQPLTLDTLHNLYDLTRYENLTPRFVATVPQCWNEIQQEQQQRRHPQHLHQQGEANKHTRSWKLRQDSASWDEHVFEIVLPRPTTVGHFDLKFSLHPMCTSPPNIQVTLYKQKSSSFSRQVLEEPVGTSTTSSTNVTSSDTTSSAAENEEQCPVDQKIDFKLGDDESAEVKKSSCEQLQPDCVEVVCGPLELANHVDMSGRSGIITMTSPQLLKLKTKTLLLHMKAMIPLKDQPTQKKKESSSSTKKTDSEKKSKSKESSPLPGTLAAASQEMGAKLSEAVIRQTLESVKGCDWVNEISITIRRNKLSPLPNPRAQRLAMLETGSFHEQLLIVACGLDAGSVVSACEEQKQHLALDLLSWILAVQVCDVSQRPEPLELIGVVEANLRGLVQASYLESGRSLAHQCTKLITQCLDFTRGLADPSAHNSLTLSLHGALLECLPAIPSAKSAGALKWFFTLLNRVKLVDSGATGHQCTTLLSSIAQQYSQRHSALHSLLKTRFGLYGHPFDAELFDIDPPQQARTNSNGSPTYASLFHGGSSGTGGNGSNSSSWNAEEFDSKELLSLTNSDKAANSTTLNSKLHSDLVTRHVCGLLEVEPLHYTVHATSDGTKVERVDTTTGPGSSATVVAPTTISSLAGGTMNFGENLVSSSMVGAAMGVTPADLEWAKFNQKPSHLKQQYKYKLEQKIAETSKLAFTPTSSSSAYNSELFPPTPKNTPFFMTPPLTPPNEAFVNQDSKQSSSKSSSGKDTPPTKSAFMMSNVSHLFQAPPAQALVVERISSVSTLPGARRYVVLDFGKPILLSDVIIPACLDLASLSIDVWLSSEETDGQRLVVTTDISLKSLVLCDLAPKICCRYLKVTTLGRYGSNATKSKIPIGSFYGHTFMLPWEIQQIQSNGQSIDSSNTNISSTAKIEQSHVLSQIGVYISLQEDIQCRYSLACNRLETLLTAIETPQGGTTHTQYYLKKVKKSDEDSKIYQAYHECMSLQLQLNVARRAIERLQKALGVATVHSRPYDLTREATTRLLQQASTDRLRVLCELLLDCVMSITFPTAALMTHPPVSLYACVTPALCEELFKHLCVHGSKKMQMYTGLFLVRVCGCQAWWGRFLGNMLQQYFIAEQPQVFPQDRVFLLLVSLGQRSLTSNKACDILESLLMMLANILSPLSSSGTHSHTSGLRSLDLTLIGWLLLFLSKCMDHVASSPLMADKHGGAYSKDSTGVQNRWDFLQGEAAMQNTKASGSTSPSKLMRRKYQKRLMQPKQQLYDYQKAKIALDNQDILLNKAEKNMLEKAKGLLKDAESCIEQLESQKALKAKLKQSKESLLKQYSTKHLKDAMNMLKTDPVETLRKHDQAAGAVGGSDSGAPGGDPGSAPVLIVRERCVPVIRGLVALLLSMDFTCNVDLFIIASKVIARVTQLTRPAICLSEVLSQAELEQLLMLMCNIEYNNGNVRWGGAWAGHAITCLLQDILEGERLSPQFECGLGGLTDDEALASSAAAANSASSANQDASVTSSNTTGASGGAATSTIAASETDESLQHSTTLPSLTGDDESSSAASLSAVASKDNLASEGDNNNTLNSSYNDEKENWLDMLLTNQDAADDLFPFKAKDFMPSVPNWPKPLAPMQGPPLYPMPPSVFSAPGSSAVSSTIKTSSGTKNLGALPNLDLVQSLVKFNEFKKGQGVSGSRMSDYIPSKSSAVCGQGVSTAMDVRLEYGLDMASEMKLRLMMTMEALRVHNALTAPIQPPPSSSGDFSCPQTDDEQLNEATLMGAFRPMQIVPSGDMLSCCFNSLFMQLPMQRINLDSLLQIWLTLNEDTTQEENGVSVFDSSKTPSIPLSSSAVTSLLTALSWAPSVPVHTWVLAFQVLSLVLNQKVGDNGRSSSPREGGVSTSANTSPNVSSSSDATQCMATLIVSNSNLMEVLVKFLSGTSVHGPLTSSAHQSQVGPTATRCFYLLLKRILWRSPAPTCNNFKQLLLKLLYNLCSESTRGALQCQVGPQDAQCKLIDYMTELTFNTIDISNAISVIEAITKLVHQHIIAQDRVVCKSSSENAVSARSCFGGLLGTMLRTGVDSKSNLGDCSRDAIMSGLLKLVNQLVQLPVPEQVRGGSGLGGVNRRRTDELETDPVSPLTDTRKISQAFGAGAEVSGILTSTPTAALSDEEKRQQGDEPEEFSATLLSPRPKSCSHFSDVTQPDREATRENTLGFIVLSHYQTVMHLIQALSSCSSNTMAMILGSSMRGNIKDTCESIDTISVGDGVFDILCSLNRKASDLTLILKPLHDYLSGSLQGSVGGRLCRLSEPLLWFMLRVLDCPHSIRAFMDMGGVKVLCESLVRSSQQVINTAPSLVSTMMCSLGSTSSKSSRKLDLTESQDQLINFAPLGTVSSGNPSAGSADLLIGSAPPHRRARSAAFSYPFAPDEMWMDLTITLPCSVVLKEVHIQPHTSSACPASVSLEVSRDGMACVPLCAPQSTSGFTTIKLQLLKPEVVTAVTIRLHRPLDTNSIGLSQIRLMGNTAFGETGAALKQSNFFTPVEDYVSKTSVGWLRLLHHCLCHSEEVAQEVAAAAAPTPQLLATCSALLLSPSAIIYDHNVEQVLLKMGLYSEEMGLSLIDYLLKGTSRRQTNIGVSHAMHGHKGGMANESTIDILYYLGIMQDLGTKARVQAMCDWLEQSAAEAMNKQRATSTTSPNSRFASQPYHLASASIQQEAEFAAPGHVQCIAAILWHSNNTVLAYDLQALLSEQLLKYMYEWSCLTSCDSALKQGIDSVICSMCYIQPQFYYLLLQWTKVLPSSQSAPLTDDHKDERQQLGALTDDTKAADNEAQRLSQPITDDQAAAHAAQSRLADLNHMYLDHAHLTTLAMASQSSEALSRLLDTGFLSLLCQALFDFCTNEMSKYVEVLIGRESMTDASKSASTSPRRPEGTNNGPKHSASSSSVLERTIAASQASDVLHLLADTAQELGVKNWLGAEENSAFWPVLLNLLCTTPSHVASTVTLNARQHMLSSGDRSRLETETVYFFKQVISCHQDNQLRFAQVLCDVMSTTGFLGQSSALSGFMRRLFLQVLLEDEKVLVSVHSHTQMYKGTSFSNAARHPRCGAGHKYRAVYASLNSTCAEILHKISDTASLSDPSSSGEKTESAKPDIAEMGLQVMKLSQVAGLSAQEKRNKSSSASASTSTAGLDGLPPRPPSRRGHRPVAPLATNASSSSGLMVAPALHLFHTLLPHQPLPGNLTLAQLCTMLQARSGATSVGVGGGQSYALSTFFQFKMKLRSKLIEDITDDDSGLANDIIPDSVLLETSSIPSALQVFASVGGLSLLAEHLPVLYPEVSRVSNGNEDGGSSKGVTSIGGGAMMGHDWVTVESADELYEEMYDALPMPLSGSGQSQSRDGKQMTGTLMLPSIPPHSLVSFGVFLRLPGYAEVLLKERRKAQCLLRLVLGVTDDGEGGHILSNSVASSLPTLPFTVLRSLCDSTPLSTDDGVLLRRMTLEIGVVHLLLACMSVLSHQAPRQHIPGFHHEVIQAAMQSASATSTASRPQESKVISTSAVPDEKCQQYWAKGTGFGTGSTISSWDAEQSLLRQRSEEEHVTCLVQVLASFINPGGQVPDNFLDPSYDEEEAAGKCVLPAGFSELLTNSCLVPAVCSYIRNDSVLDMSRHIPLYRALLELLRAVSVCPSLVHLLLPLDNKDGESSAVSIVELLEKMRSCVDTYASRLKSNKGKNGSNGKSKSASDVEDSEGLALLIPDIQSSAKIVYLASQRLKQKTMDQEGENDGDQMSGAAKVDHSMEDKYTNIMKGLQFDTYEMVTEDDNGGIKFLMTHHYESNVKSAGDVNNAARARRLAQEAVTLSTSLPLSYNSTVFVRCDEERLDVMKVLITGPSDTPYGNGCFEFDVYFPQDYPTSPPLVNLETTGNKTVRFNPNLYNDGKVCLSVLNTWHGRPEEKWNAQTSSFLQVLVSIQSLILVSEPYFNEPGYERSRGTPSGTASSREYDANIRQATVKWSMLEMLRNPPACFKQVIQTHMWMKRNEICAQVEEWIQELESFSSDKRTGRSIAHSLVALKRHYSQLREEFAKMKPPPDLEDEEDNHPDKEHLKAGTSSKTGTQGTSTLQGVGSPLSNSTSSTVTLSDSVTSSTCDSALSQEYNPNFNKYKPSGSSSQNLTETNPGLSDNGGSKQQITPNHVGMNHVDESDLDPEPPHVPMSNGDVSEDFASMMLGPEEDNSNNIFFL